MKRRNFLQTIAYSSLGAGIDFVHPVKTFTAKTSEINPVGEAKHFGDDRNWFFEKRFGMFVHWGLYAIPGWHEQHQWRARVERSEYAKLINQRNPTYLIPTNEWI